MSQKEDKLPDLKIPLQIPREAFERLSHKYDINPFLDSSPIYYGHPVEEELEREGVPVPPLPDRTEIEWRGSEMVAFKMLMCKWNSELGRSDIDPREEELAQQQILQELLPYFIDYKKVYKIIWDRTFIGDPRLNTQILKIACHLKQTI